MFSRSITVLFFLTTIFYGYGTTQLTEAKNSSQLTEEEKKLIINNPIFAELFHAILERVSSLEQEQQQQKNNIAHNAKPQISQSIDQQLIDQNDQTSNRQNVGSQITQDITQQELNTHAQNSINQTSASQISQINAQNIASRIVQAGPQLNAGTSQASSNQTGELKQKELAANYQTTLPPAKKPRYQFGTRVDDNINGNFQQREETRDGNKVTGSYAYDDGYVFRTVMYEADEKGFRVVKEEIQPSIKAQQNLTGEAEVVSYLNGDMMEYEITTTDNNRED